jgi:hypothetical protein
MTLESPSLAAAPDRDRWRSLLREAGLFDLPEGDLWQRPPEHVADRAVEAARDLTVETYRGVLGGASAWVVYVHLARCHGEEVCTAMIHGEVGPDSTEELDADPTTRPDVARTIDLFARSARNQCC